MGGAKDIHDIEWNSCGGFLRSNFERPPLARLCDENLESKWESAEGHGKVEQAGCQAPLEFPAAAEEVEQSLVV
jgi:hypothetical protein